MEHKKRRKTQPTEKELEALKNLFRFIDGHLRGNIAEMNRTLNFKPDDTNISNWKKQGFIPFIGIRRLVNSGMSEKYLLTGEEPAFRNIVADGPVQKIFGEDMKMFEIMNFMYEKINREQNEKLVEFGKEIKKMMVDMESRISSQMEALKKSVAARKRDGKHIPNNHKNEHKY